MEVIIWNQDCKYNETDVFIIFPDFNYLSYWNDKMFTPDKSINQSSELLSTFCRKGEKVFEYSHY